jgi:hypothetical protein
MLGLYLAIMAVFFSNTTQMLFYNSSNLALLIFQQGENIIAAMIKVKKGD